MELLNTLPVFENSQVLTASQLNSMRDYLQQQNNITRVALIGRGIVCGLAATKNGDSYNITSGIGISSWGFLFCMNDCTLTEYREYKIPEGTDYFPFQDATGQQNIILYELLPATEAGKNGAKSLTQFSAGNLNEFVVLLYMEEYNKDLKSCLGKSCDELGVERTYTVRKLLIRKTELNTVNSETENHGGYLYPGLMSIPDLHLMRPMINKFSVSSYPSMVLSYLAPVAAIGKAFFANFEAVYTAIKPVLQKDYPNSPVQSIKLLWNENLNKMTDAYLSGKAFGFQYFYDMADDAVKSLNELVCAAMHLNSQCKFNSNAFPMHLMLGTITCPPDQYRQEFVYSPLFNEQKDWTDRVKKLFSRTADIVKNFDIKFFENTLKDGVFATPSKEKWQNLGERAIPVYYKPNVFDANWNEKKCGVCYTPGKTILSYYKQINSPTAGFEKTPWLFNTNEYEFIRLEGQQGMGISEAFAELNKLGKRNNLPYKIQYAHLGTGTGKTDFTGDSCCFPDLDVKYLPWRNKYLYYVRNILNVTKKVENLFSAFSTAYKNTQKTDAYYAKSNIPFSAKASAPVAPEEILANDATAANDPAVKSMSGFQKTMFSVASFQEHYASARANQKAANIGDNATGTGADTSDMEKIFGWVVDFNNCLEGMEDVLPKNFCDYDHNKFTSQYACSMNKWVALLKIVKDIINTKRDSTQTKNLLNLILLFQTIAFFKDLIFIDIDTIAEMKEKRLKNIQSGKSFERAAKTHTGLEHLAGVHRNDSLLLVYHTGDEKDNPNDIKAIEKEFEAFGKNDDLTAYLKKFAEIEKKAGTKFNELLAGKVIADYTIHSDSCCDCDADVQDYDELAPQAFPRAYAFNLDLTKDGTVNILRPVNVFYHPDRYKIVVSSTSVFSQVSVITEPYNPMDGKLRQVISYKLKQAELNKSQNLKNMLVILDEFTYEIEDKLNNNAILDSGKISIFLYREKIAALPKFQVDGTLVNQNGAPVSTYQLKITDTETHDIISTTTMKAAGKGHFQTELEPGNYEFLFAITGGRISKKLAVEVVDADLHLGKISLVAVGK